MIRLAKALATAAMLLFGAALLTAANDGSVTCRIQYRYAGFSVEARCVGQCQDGNCELAVWYYGPWIGYSCECDDGSTGWCIGALLQGERGIGAVCLNPFDACGWHLDHECRSFVNDSPDFVDACRCVPKDG